MKPVGVVLFKNRKAMREGNYESIENFEIEVIDEGSLYKVLVVPEKSMNTKKPGKYIWGYWWWLILTIRCEFSKRSYTKMW